MKILYAIQGTGNGHISRARDIIPVLQNYGAVDILISGSQSDVNLDYPVKYQLYGLSFIFGKRGGINIFRTIIKARLFTFLKDIFSLNVSQYDLIINDFEPVSAWACLIKNKKCISLSHQGAVINRNAPKPKKIDLSAVFILKYYAPAASHYSFHFDTYAENIFTPVIRSSIRAIESKKEGHYTVYLPAYSDERIISILSFLPVQWEVFSKHAIKEKEIFNVKIYPVNNNRFIKSLSTCNGIICGAGFEGPAEALFLGKKLMVIPMKGQYEQQCNAAALEKLGVMVLKNLKQKNKDKIEEFIKATESPKINFPNQTAVIIEKIIQEQVFVNTEAPFLFQGFRNLISYLTFPQK